MDEKELDLLPRKEETREKNRLTINVIRFELDEIGNHFNENVSYIRKQFDIADELINDDRVEEAINVWSSQIVFLESAFDFYLHELTKYGLAEIFDGNWEKTEKYKNLSVRMSVVDQALKAKENTGWFLEFVNSFYREETLISYNAVKDQMNLLGIDINTVADKVFYDKNSNVKTIAQMRLRLEDLYKVRNIIAHQAGRRHADAKKEIVTKEIVQENIYYIESIVHAIQDEARKKG